MPGRVIGDGSRLDAVPDRLYAKGRGLAPKISDNPEPTRQGVLPTHGRRADNKIRELISTSRLGSRYPMSNFPSFETDRLQLREIVASDAHDLLAIHSNQRAMQWYGADPLKGIEQAEKLIAVFASWRQLPNPGARWGIQRKSDRQFLGSCGLFKWNRPWKSCVIGYELAASARGNGFMLEALSAMLDWGFRNMELNRIEAQVHRENLASTKLLEKLGFVWEGCMREAGFWNGGHHDLQQFALLQRDKRPLAMARN
jgi:ribosomal-protein-alanine N-acetyltransferase